MDQGCKYQRSSRRESDVLEIKSERPDWRWFGHVQKRDGEYMGRKIVRSEQSKQNKKGSIHVLIFYLFFPSMAAMEARLALTARSPDI